MSFEYCRKIIVTRDKDIIISIKASNTSGGYENYNYTEAVKMSIPQADFYIVLRELFNDIFGYTITPSYSVIETSNIAYLIKWILQREEFQFYKYDINKDEQLKIPIEMIEKAWKEIQDILNSKELYLIQHIKQSKFYFNEIRGTSVEGYGVYYDTYTPPKELKRAEVIVIQMCTYTEFNVITVKKPLT